MNFIAWNCRGRGNPCTVRAFKKLLKDKDPTLVLISDTKKKDFEMNNVRHLQGLSNMVAVSCYSDGRERAGGPCMFMERLH